MPNKSLLLDALTHNRPPRMAQVNRPRKPGMIAALGRLLLGHPGSDGSTLGKIGTADSLHAETPEMQGNNRRAA